MTEEQPSHNIGWPEIAKLVFTSKGITSGLWRFGVKLRFAAMGMEFMELKGDGNTGSLTALPAAIAAIESIVVFPAAAPGPMVFDASAPAVQAKPQRPPANPSKAASKKSIKQGTQSIKAADKLPNAKTRVKKAAARPAT